MSFFMAGYHLVQYRTTGALVHRLQARLLICEDPNVYRDNHSIRQATCRNHHNRNHGMGCAHKRNSSSPNGYFFYNPLTISSNSYFSSHCIDSRYTRDGNDVGDRTHNHSLDSGAGNYNGCHTSRICHPVDKCAVANGHMKGNNGFFCITSDFGDSFSGISCVVTLRKKREINLCFFFF